MRKRARPKPSKRSRRSPDKRNRNTRHLLIYGLHAVKAALANPLRRIISLHGTAERLAELQNDLPAIMDDLAAVTHCLDRGRLDDMFAGLAPADSGKVVHQGIVAAAEPLASPHLEDWLAGVLPSRPLLVVLDQVTDGRNIGAIMRSAHAFGACGMVVTSRHAPAESGAMLRAASGAGDRIPLFRVVNLARSIERLQDAGFTVAGLDASDGVSIASLSGEDRLALVMGAEGRGLRRLTREKVDVLARIPTLSSAESLNVSVAAGVALYATRADGDEV